MVKAKNVYESRAEELNSYGTSYRTYGIFLKKDGEVIPLQHDVARSEREANRICELLNKYDLEPEQARYVIEDCIIESYLV